jgi:hypothetical protein
MTAATCGDFLKQVDTQLEAASARSWSAAADPAVVAGSLGRVAAGMARYLEDRVPAYAAGAAGQMDLQPWEHAVTEAAMALRKATHCLDRAAAAGRGEGPGSQGGPRDYLTAAATSLVAGRDLLHTHLTAGTDDVRQPRSEWAQVVMSLPVTRALAGEIARWSRPLALLAADLASAAELSPTRNLAAGEGLEVATGWLWRAGAVVATAKIADPVTDDDLTILRAIPALRPGPRLPPDGHESVADLCAGITRSAERLRTAVFTACEPGSWASTTADTWRWTARAAAVAGHISELVLRSLSRDAGPVSRPAGTAASLQAAADTLAKAWTAWRQVCAGWTDLTTATRGHQSSAVTDIGDLVLRLGRLAWDDPRWSPASGRTARPRAASGLAAGGGDKAVLAAVHQATDALARVAAANLAAVQALDHADRLYVPTRRLPDGFDVPQPYAVAPTALTLPLLDAYRMTVRTATRAASELAALALAAGAPSSGLALARTVSASHTQAANPSPAPAAPAAPAIVARSPAGYTPGPTELTIRKLHISDPALLLRAAAIDSAAQRLIAQAEQVSAPPDQPSSRSQTQRRPPGRPAQLAAKDLPRSHPAALASARPPAHSNGNGSTGPQRRPQNKAIPSSPPSFKSGQRTGTRLPGRTNASRC